MENANKIVITRNFDAPRELVFKAWAEVEQLAKWWGPKEATINKSSVNPDGSFHYSMQFPGQPELWGLIVYKEILAPERVAFVSSFADEKGNVAPNPWAPVWPLEILNVATFTEHNGVTTLTLTGSPLNATADEQKVFESAMKDMQRGTGGMLDKFEAYVATINNQKQ